MLSLGKKSFKKLLQLTHIENDKKDSKMVTTKTPENFQPYSLCGWNTFNRELENYLSGIKGIPGVPLVYIIHKEQPDAVPLALPNDENQQLIRQAPL